MLIDSVIIKLIRNGAGVSPDYSLTIYGYGALEYNGIENVEVKGKVEEEFDYDKVISLLSKFKSSGFFSLNNQYSVDESAGPPFTVISISMPVNDGEMKIKNITHYNDDENVPNELKNLEEQIDEITMSDRWVGKSSEIEHETQSDEKKKNSRLLNDDEKFLYMLERNQRHR